jgi:hypothetical protein
MLRFFPRPVRSLTSLFGFVINLVSDGFGFLRLTLRSHTALSAEILFLRKQLAFYVSPRVAGTALSQSRVQFRYRPLHNDDMLETTTVVTPARFEQGLRSADFLAQARFNHYKFELYHRDSPLTQTDRQNFHASSIADALQRKLPTRCALVTPSRCGSTLPGRPMADARRRRFDPSSAIA